MRTPKRTITEHSRKRRWTTTRSKKNEHEHNPIPEEKWMIRRTTKSSSHHQYHDLHAWKEYLDITGRICGNLVRRGSKSF
jgi:hypothetical protein